MDNKFPGKDISLEDLKSKFPLAAKKMKIINLNLRYQVLNLDQKPYQYLLAQTWLKVRN